MKRKSLLSILTAFMLAVMALSLSGCGESTDYIASVKQMAPYESSGISATYGEVLDKYISSCEWQERIESEDLAYVDASGKLIAEDGREIDVAITFKVTPYEGKTEGMVWIEPYIGELGEESYTTEDVSVFMEELFDAYSGGYESLADYYATIYE